MHYSQIYVYLGCAILVSYSGKTYAYRLPRCGDLTKPAVESVLGSKKGVTQTSNIVTHLERVADKSEQDAERFLRKLKAQVQKKKDLEQRVTEASTFAWPKRILEMMRSANSASQGSETGASGDSGGSSTSGQQRARKRAPRRHSTGSALLQRRSHKSFKKVVGFLEKPMSFVHREHKQKIRSQFDQEIRREIREMDERHPMMPVGVLRNFDKGKKIIQKSSSERFVGMDSKPQGKLEPLSSTGLEIPNLVLDDPSQNDSPAPATAALLDSGGIQS